MIRSALFVALSLTGMAHAELVLQQPPPDHPAGGAVFHSGTRLVEVEVVVRGQQAVPPGAGSFLNSAFVGGPPFGPPGPIVSGLTKDDFTLLDNGKPQPIALFRAGPAVANRSDQPRALPAGAISNRVDNQGLPLNRATVVLIDQLNTSFDLLGYEREGTVKLLRSLTAKDNRVAVYTPGETLHVLQDFTSDPQRLAAAAAKLEGSNGTPASDLKASDLKNALNDFGDVAGFDVVGNAELIPNDGGIAVRAQMTTIALKLVIQNLSRLPGRKNLVWLMGDPNVPPAVMAMLRQADVALYPVLVRAVGESGVLSKKFASGQLAGFSELRMEREARAIAAATGGEAFFDSMDLPFAVRAAEEDERSSYVLGFYPSEETLDGRYHTISVKFEDPKRNKALEATYRPGYFASKLPTDAELFQNPLESTSVGLTAAPRPDPSNPELRQMQITVDVRDLQLEPKDGRFTGELDLLILLPSSSAARTKTVHIDFPEAQLPKALETGYTLTIGGIPAQSGELRVLVRDQATGAAGSLRIPAEVLAAK
jgi:VWFA-related protein